MIAFIITSGAFTITSCDVNLQDIKDVINKLTDKDKDKDKDKEKDEDEDKKEHEKDGELEISGLSLYSEVISYAINNGEKNSVEDIIKANPTDTVIFYVLDDTMISRGTAKEYAFIMKTMPKKEDPTKTHKSMMEEPKEHESLLTLDKESVSRLLAVGNEEEKTKINDFLTTHTTTGDDGKVTLKIDSDKEALKETLDFKPKKLRPRLDTIAMPFSEIHPWRNSYKGELKLNFPYYMIATYSKAKIYLGSNGKKLSDWNWKNGDWDAIKEEAAKTDEKKVQSIAEYQNTKNCDIQQQIQGRAYDNYASGFNALNMKNYSGSIAELSLGVETVTNIGVYSVTFKLVCKSRWADSYHTYLKAPITSFMVYGIDAHNNEVFLEEVPITDYIASNKAYPRIITENNPGNYGYKHTGGKEIHFTDIAKGEAFRLGNIALNTDNIPDNMKIQYKIGAIYGTFSAIPREKGSLMSLMTKEYRAEFIADLRDITPAGTVDDAFIKYYLDSGSTIFSISAFFYTNYPATDTESAYQGGVRPVSGVWLDYDENGTVPWSAIAGRTVNFSFRYADILTDRPSHASSTRVIVEMPQ